MIADSDRVLIKNEKSRYAPVHSNRLGAKGFMMELSYNNHDCRIIIVV